jgi:hypothetical protein
LSPDNGRCKHKITYAEQSGQQHYGITIALIIRNQKNNRAKKRYQADAKIRDSDPVTIMPYVVYAGIIDLFVQPVNDPFNPRTDSLLRG